MMNTIKPLLLFLFIILSSLSKAQVTLNIMTNDGITEEYMLKDKPVLVLDGNNIVVRSNNMSGRHSIVDIEKMMLEKECVPPTDNNVNVNDTMSVQGRIVVLPVYLKNCTGICNVQFDVHLPQGIMFDYTTDESQESRHWKASLGEKRFMDADHSLSINQLSDHKMRFAITSETKRNIPDEDSEGGSLRNEPLLNLTLRVDESLTSGDYDIHVSKVILSQYDAVAQRMIKFGGIGSKSLIDVVAKEQLYDVDSDGKIDGKDVTQLADVLIGKVSGSNNPMLYDIDGDGKTDVNDIVILIQQILTSETADDE